MLFFLRALSILGGFLFFKGSGASLLEDQRIGLARFAHQDTLGATFDNDPFVSAINPAWAPEQSQWAFSSFLMDAQLPAEVLEQNAYWASSLAFHHAFEKIKMGFLGVFPVSQQKILNTGDPEQRRSPWQPLAQQISFRPYLSWRGVDSKWSWGVMFPIYWNAQGRAFLRVEDPAKVRAEVSLEPSYSWVFGGQYKNSWGSFSLSYREKQEANADFSFDTDLPLLSASYFVDAFAPYLFSPRRVMMQMNKALGRWNVGAQLRRSFWGHMKSPYLQFIRSQPNMTVAEFPWEAKNSWDFGLGFSYRLNKDDFLLASLVFAESPFKKIDSFYDRDQWVGAVGYLWKNLFKELSASFSYRYHHLEASRFYSSYSFGLSYSL